MWAPADPRSSCSWPGHEATVALVVVAVHPYSGRGQTALDSRARKPVSGMRTDVSGATLHRHYIRYEKFTTRFDSSSTPANEWTSTVASSLRELPFAVRQYCGRLRTAQPNLANSLSHRKRTRRIEHVLGERDRRLSGDSLHLRPTGATAVASNLVVHYGNTSSTSVDVTHIVMPSSRTPGIAWRLVDKTRSPGTCFENLFVDGVGKSNTSRCAPSRCRTKGRLTTTRDTATRATPCWSTT